MLRNKLVKKLYFFSYKKSLKNSSYRYVLSSFTETKGLKNFNNLVERSQVLQIFFFDKFFELKQTREVLNCVFKDMMHLVIMWRHIRGYPQGGNTTHTNANTAKKNKLLLNFRINQFYEMFGQKKRNIYPTLVKAEYNNRLWYYNWPEEWAQARIFATKMAAAGQKGGSFNPALLAGNQTNGYKRTGKAAKIGKAKKLVKVFTVGVPLLFSRYIYLSNPPMGFPKLVLRDEVNKRLGKKFRNREIRRKKNVTNKLFW